MRLGRTVTAIGFWSATLLPVCYLPMVATGIDSAFRAVAFVGLLALNALALVVGHDYRRA